MNTQEAVEDVKNRIKAFKLALLDEYLSQCTPKENALFDRLYPNGPSADQLEEAIYKSARTALKHGYRRQT